MPVPTFSITCTAKTLLAPGVYELVFAKPKGFAFKAGQFLLFDVPLLDDPHDLQTRAYSIASSPHEPDLLFVIKLIPGGRASAWFEKAVDVGAIVTAKGPFGAFTIDPALDCDLLLIGTGTGVAPYRSHVITLLKNMAWKRQIHLIFGVRHQADLFWMDLWNSLAIEHPQFHFHPAITGDDAAWQGQRGRVYDIAPKVIPDFSSVQIMACGAPQMVQSVKEKALTEWKMEKKRVKAEGYV